MDISALEIILAIGMAVFTITMAWVQIVRTRRTRTSDLYHDFYCSDHYRRVVLPVFRVYRKLEALPADEREEYYRAILTGWEHHPDDPVQVWHAMVPANERERHPLEQHFMVESSTEAHSEHEALTSFLYFWVRAHRMLVTNLIDKGLFCELFCNSFKYYDDFLDDLRERVRARIDDADEPSWVVATSHIQNLLKARDCPT